MDEKNHPRDDTISVPWERWAKHLFMLHQSLWLFSDQPAHSGDLHDHLLKIILSNQSTFFLPLLTTKETKEKLASRHTPAPLESSPCEEEAHSVGCGHPVVEF